MRSTIEMMAKIGELRHRESLLVGGGDDHTRKARKKWRGIYAAEREFLEWLLGDRKRLTWRAFLIVLKGLIGRK